MQLDQVVPWGRSLAEYREMFDLSEDDKHRRILGCADGPASFNAELSFMGGEVVSVDPLYQFSADEIYQRVLAVFKTVMDEVEANQADFNWDVIPNTDRLGEMRLAAMESFIADYRTAQPGRYVAASLPNLPFDNNHFEIALCSHFLFLYSDKVDLATHLASVNELCRVAQEVRIYPLVDLNGQPSAHVQAVIDDQTAQGREVSLVDSDYHFQKGADQLLVIRTGQ